MIDVNLLENFSDSNEPGSFLSTGSGGRASEVKRWPLKLGASEQIGEMHEILHWCGYNCHAIQITSAIATMMPTNRTTFRPKFCCYRPVMQPLPAVRFSRSQMVIGGGTIEGQIACVGVGSRLVLYDISGPRSPVRSDLRLPLVQTPLHQQGAQCVER